MNEQLNFHIIPNLLKQTEWHPNFNEECDFVRIPSENRIRLHSEDKSTLRRGFMQEVILEAACTYRLSCDLNVLACPPIESNATPCGAYLAVYDPEQKETARTQRYDIPTEGDIRLELSFLNLQQHKPYRIGLYVDGICTAEFSNPRLQKEAYLDNSQEDDPMA